MTEKFSGIREYAAKLSPQLRSGLGAAATLGLYAALGLPAARSLMEKMHKGVTFAHNEKPQPIQADQHGPELVKWIEKFKDEHPETSSVPVFVSGKVPVSMYIPALSFKIPGAKEKLDEKWNVKEPGVYLKELSAPIALHELGHVAIERKIPPIRLLTSGTSALALGLLGWSIAKKPSAAPGFIERYAPAISAALQVPLLAEEGAASIMAEKSMRREGESGKEKLVPAWLTYLVQAGMIPAGQTVATLLKKGI